MYGRLSAMLHAADPPVRHAIVSTSLGNATDEGGGHVTFPNRWLAILNADFEDVPELEDLPHDPNNTGED